MDLVKGMDVSFTKELEERGARYYLNNTEKDVFSILKECGTNLIRLRLWMNPYDEDGNTYGGGMNDIATTIELARRVKQNDMQFMLDIHYSDFWADPARQYKPKAWESLKGRDLEEAVYEYTLRVMNVMKDENLNPEYVQVGNEITNGFLWPDGKNENLEEMVSLLKSGISGVRAVSPESKIVIHLDFGTDNEMYRRWFNAIEPYHLDYDIIGMSFYPYWNGSIKKIKANMNDISKTFDKDVMIVETSIGYTTDSLGCDAMVYSEEFEKETGYPATEEGQSRFLEDLFKAVREVDDSRGKGIIYWEPGWLPIPECAWATKVGQIYMKDEVEPGNSHGNQALFDSKGNANKALYKLSEM